MKDILQLLWLIPLAYWTFAVVKGIYRTVQAIWLGKMFEPGTVELLGRRRPKSDNFSLATAFAYLLIK